MCKSISRWKKKVEHHLDIGKITDFRETSEGFLDVYLSFSKVGPLIYQRSDGGLETEYLTEDELFNEDSISTATGKPITWQHPPEWVSKDNARKYVRGSTSAKIIKDTPFATILATIHDGELIEIIKSGKAKQVSAGYNAKVIKKDDGKLYQQDRRYNHFAVVPAGRAGPDVRVHFDGVDEVSVQVTDEPVSTLKPNTTMTFTELKIDDKTTIKVGSSEGEQAIARYLRDALEKGNALSGQLAIAQADAQKVDGLAGELKATQVERDQQKARADVAEQKLSEAGNMKVDAEEIKSAFNQGYQRHLLEQTAAKFLPADAKVDAHMSDKDIKLTVIKNQLKLKADSDEAKRYDAQSDAYIDAAYDLLTKQDSSTLLKVAAVDAKPTEQPKQDAAEMAYAAYVERLKKGKSKTAGSAT